MGFQKIYDDVESKNQGSIIRRSIRLNQGRDKLMRFLRLSAQHLTRRSRCIDATPSSSQPPQYWL
jgi:hypothetical protein